MEGQVLHSKDLTPMTFTVPTPKHSCKLVFKFLLLHLSSYCGPEFQHKANTSTIKMLQWSIFKVKSRVNPDLSN